VDETLAMKVAEGAERLLGDLAVDELHDDNGGAVLL